MRRTESQWRIVPNCNLSEGPKMSNPKRSVHEVRAGSLCQSFKVFEIDLVHNPVPTAKHPGRRRFVGSAGR